MEDKQQHSIGYLLMQLNEMIQLIQNHKGPIAPNITPKVLADIKSLEETIHLFTEINETAFPTTPEDLKQSLESSTLNPKDKQLIQRAENIANDAKNLQLVLSKAIERGKKKRKGSKKNLSKYNQERRKLFKPLGEDKNWIPL